MEEKDYELMEKEGLGWMNPFSREFVYYTPEQIEKNKCEKMFKDKLYGEIWREIPCDFEQAAHYEEEAMERLKKAPKDISAALEYLPTYIKVLRAACEFIAPLLLSTVEEMTIANFNSTDTERFAEGWIDAMEQCGIEESMLLDFYLLGQCSLSHHEAPVVMARAKKNFARALENLPKLLFASECYDYDLKLQRLVYNMRKVGYSEDKVAVFATRYVTVLWDIIEAEVWYSSMHMQLFGEHMSGARVDIDGLGDFEKAIEFLPEYVDFVVDVEVLSRYTNRLDPDEVLYALIEKMREHDFSKEQISRFATEWMNAMEKTGNVSYMRMHAYLFDEFSYAMYPPENNYKLVYDITPLCGLKDFARALEHIPEWIEYMNSPEHYDFVQPPDICVNDVTLKMRECGYTDTEVEEFNARVLASMPATSPDLNDF